jgi:hypothetical protein
LTGASSQQKTCRDKRQSIPKAFPGNLVAAARLRFDEAHESQCAVNGERSRLRCAGRLKRTASSSGPNGWDKFIAWYATVVTYIAYHQIRRTNSIAIGCSCPASRDSRSDSGKKEGSRRSPKSHWTASPASPIGGAGDGSEYVPSPNGRTGTGSIPGPKPAGGLDC